MRLYSKSGGYPLRNDLKTETLAFIISTDFKPRLLRSDFDNGVHER